jgi:hypothetical protein
MNHFIQAGQLLLSFLINFIPNLDAMTPPVDAVILIDPWTRCGS